MPADNAPDLADVKLVDEGFESWLAEDLMPKLDHRTIPERDLKLMHAAFKAGWGSLLNYIDAAVAEGDG